MTLKQFITFSTATKMADTGRWKIVCLAYHSLRSHIININYTAKQGRLP